MRNAMREWGYALVALSVASIGCGGTDHPGAGPGGTGGAGVAGNAPGSGATGSGATGSGATGNGASPGSGGTTAAPGKGGSGPGKGGTASADGGAQAPVSATFQSLKAAANAASALDQASVAAKYPTAFGTIDYDPLAAQYMDRIQASALALTDGEKTSLGKNGFVVSTGRGFATFVRGYAEIYSEHLPVYVSADAVLEAVHNGYDSMLLEMERASLITDVGNLLKAMRTRLPSSTASAAVKADLDLYLSVALTLLSGSMQSPVAGGDATAISNIVSTATAANGTGNLKLFGSDREEDFSQFKPRGHYAGDPQLEQYFRAMMWLGRVDFRIVQTDSSGKQTFMREQYDAMVAVRSLIGTDIDTWKRVDDVLSTFVGPSDNMVVPQVDQLATDLGGAAAAAKASDDAVVAAIAKGGYGEQRIASYLMVNDGTVTTIPLNRSFLIFGQRYIVDSDVFSSVVYDRIPGRYMPNPLDAAFGALANNQAFALDPDAKTVPALPGALARVRVLVDSNDGAFWQSSFYNLWLTALRALSPVPDASKRPAGLPKLATTEAWGRRLLNTQLGSWAELRHDTLLYAKQSYTGIPGCGFPDAYVDPYPEFFAALHDYAAQGTRIADFAKAANASLGATIAAYFKTLGDASQILEDIATAELQGKDLTADQLAFVNDAVRIEKQSAGCTTVEVPDGWLAKLYYDPAKSIEFNPTIADVHTQPADAAGNTVGNVLHVGTGYPRLMVATMDSCGGSPRAYAGVVFAYHEETTSNFTRLTDQDWAMRFGGSAPPPADVPWLAPVLAH